MYQKQNVVFLDGLIMMLVASLLLGAWSVTRSLSLVRPSVQGTSPPVSIIEPLAPAALPDPQLLQTELTLAFKTDLKAELNKFTAAQTGDFAVYVHELDSDTAVSASANRSFISASLYKPFVAVAALKMVDQGSLSLDTILADTGGRDVRQCVIDTISVSDNPCGLSLLSTTQLTVPKLRAEGYARTDLSGLYPVTTAGDVAKLFEHIYKGDLLSKASNRLLLGALKQQTVNDRLPPGLPKGVSLAHKTGDLDGYAHDAGIVFGEHSDYIVVVLSGPNTDEQSLSERYTAFSRLSATIHKFVSRFQSELADAGSS